MFQNKLGIELIAIGRNTFSSVIILYKECTKLILCIIHKVHICKLRVLNMVSMQVLECFHKHLSPFLKSIQNGSYFQAGKS